LHEFRFTLLALAVAVSFATVLYLVTPHAALAGQAPSLQVSLYGAWMALLAQPILSPPETWYLTAVAAVYPIFGFVLIGEGVVHFALLMVSRRRGEKEWMRVMASTYRDHVVLCGVGKLGTRVLEQLIASGQEVVVIERDAIGRGVRAARAAGVPVLVRDMTDDDALIAAGVPYARVIVLATNEDVGNLEAALDARRMNPSIRVVLRLFDQRLASKLSDAFGIDHAFSASALAAPVVAGMTLGARVLSACTIAGVAHVTAEIAVQAGSTLVGCRVGDVELAHGVRILARFGPAAADSGSDKGDDRNPSPPSTMVSSDLRLATDDRVVVHLPLHKLDDLRRAGAAT
jgi:Trk K+ transport system NAD-binding subunit